jgi:hypothetical protein
MHALNIVLQLLYDLARCAFARSKSESLRFSKEKKESMSGSQSSGDLLDRVR